MNKILSGILILTLFLRSGSFDYMVISVMSVVVIWYFTGLLFPQERWLKEIVAFSLAISEWHIDLANFSLQASLAVFLVSFGGLILIKVIKSKWLLLSIAILVLAGNQIISPIALNLDNAQDVVWLTDQQRREHGEDYNSFLALMFHNKAVNYSLSFMEHWGEHFSGDFLFISRSTNLIFLFNILFSLVGFTYILRTEKWDKWGIIILWLILAPINSTFNFGQPDSVKSCLMIVPLVIISGYGVLTVLKFAYKRLNVL